MATITLSSLASGIKSVQRGIINPASGNTGTVTISSVNTAKSVVISDGSIISGSQVLGGLVALTNATTLTWYSPSNSTTAGSQINWQVLEFN